MRVRSFMLEQERILVFGACILWMVGMCTAAISQAGEEKHSDPNRSCVSAECHAPIVDHKYLHGPLKIGQCTVCHAPVPGPDHKFRILQDGAGMCMTCHNPVDTETFLHKPVAEGRCLDCHDPHGSASPFQIRISPIASLCNDCHDPVTTGGHPHDPVAKGECLSCHPAHGSREKKLLNVSGKKLCFSCHEEMDPAKNAGRKIHLVDEDCAGCHRPHDSGYPKLLVRPPLEICFGCHEDLQENIKSSKFKHEAVTEGQACIECHMAHNSRQASLLREPSGDLCFECHDELKARIDKAKYKHQPVANHACGSCHLPHSSSYPHRLLAPFPGSSYADYTPDSYAMCFSCHEQALTEERYTETLTGFRNGTLNLHYLHVNKKVHGRTCLTCHDAHAGNRPRLIRDETSYGSWQAPIQFDITETGGSCSSGCHQKYSYDRINPVKLKAQ